MQGWYQDNIITFEGCKIDIATSQFGTSQIIKEPTHILSNSASCIELSFTPQPNLVMHSGLHPSLHQNCHHQIVFTKFNLTFFYPPSYMRLVWHYQQANTDIIKQTIKLFDCEKGLSNLDVNKKVSVFNKAIINIFEILFCTKQSTVMTKIPPWMNKQTKTIVEKRSFI